VSQRQKSQSAPPNAMEGGTSSSTAVPNRRWNLRMCVTTAVVDAAWRVRACAAGQPATDDRRVRAGASPRGDGRQMSHPQQMTTVERPIRSPSPLRALCVDRSRPCLSNTD